jgi:hypothetical protein
VIKILKINNQTNEVEYGGLAADLVNGKPDVSKTAAPKCAAGSTFYVFDSGEGFIYDGETWWPA